jgi:hypothetical protein
MTPPVLNLRSTTPGISSLFSRTLHYRYIYRFTGCLGAVSALLLLAACQSTGIEGFAIPAAQLAAPVRDIFVVGMDERPNIRAQFENDVVAALHKRQVVAVASYPQYPLARLMGNSDQVHQTLVAANAVFVLFVRVADRATFLPGAPGSPGDMSMGAVEEARYVRFTEGAGQIQSDLRLGAKLFRVSDGHLVWSGVVDTVLKENYESIVLLQTIAKEIVARMATDKVIP